MWVQKTGNVLTRPRFGLAFFHRWMRRKLERNPIGWLEQRRWSGRVVTWSWFAIAVVVLSTAVSESYLVSDFSGFCSTLGWLLVGTMAYTAAASFRRERETGVLELLLVSPLSSAQIARQRKRSW